MRQEAKVTRKGQVTIPIEIRRVLGITEGDAVVFEADEHGVHLRRMTTAVDTNVLQAL